MTENCELCARLRYPDLCHIHRGTPGPMTPVPGATLRYDDDGNAIVDVATCGHCGRSWNDAAISSVTPVPSGRCPFEHWHVYAESA